MKALVQRVSSAEVSADGQVVGRIGRGLLVYLGVAKSDRVESVDWLAEKIAHLRIFEDDKGMLNLSVQDVGGDVLAVSNFTLMADARRGRRPSFVQAASAELAERIYQAFIESLARFGCRVAAGAFGRHMDIRSVADGPVNVVVEYPPCCPARDDSPASEAQT